jgi:mono/diheme cytochrome c family protein
MKRMPVLILTAALLLAVGILAGRAQSAAATDIPANVAQTFDKQCAGCHSGMFAPKGLKLSPSKIAAAIDAPSKEVPTLKLIDTANPEAGYILKKIEGAEGIAGVKMPKGRDLAPADLEVLKAWLLGLKAK